MSFDPPIFDAPHNYNFDCNYQQLHGDSFGIRDNFPPVPGQINLGLEFREHTDTPNSTTTEGSVTATLPEFPFELASFEPKKEIIQLDEEEQEILDYTQVKPLNHQFTDLRQENNKTVSKISSVPRNICPPECLICGEPANGYHYGVASCNGCKTFFRRSVLGNRTYKCKGNGKCMQDMAKSRTHCKACRLTKCLDMGMTPLAMEKPPPTLNEFLKNKRIKVEIDPDMPSTSKIQPPLRPDDGGINAIIDGLMYLELKAENFRASAYNPWPHSIPGLYQSVTTESLISLGDRMGPMKNWPIDPAEPALDNSNRKMWLAFDIMTAVEWAKTFPFLHQLTPNDRTILLRATALILMDMASSYFSYSNNTNYLMFPDGTNIYRHPKVPPPWSNKEAIESRKRCRDFMRGNGENRDAMTKMLNMGINVFFRNTLDKQEYVLLKAIFLTNNAVSGLSEFAQNLLAKERKKYADALLRYCQQKHGMVEGASRYAAIISLVRTFEEMSKMQKDHHVVFKIFVPKHQQIQIIDEVMSD
ncbi:hypothetical protein WR25_14083 isoform A [Diploscapter pachys]|uniref:Nuclear receptor domain-containing protein n=1 Tax=Diploscapter pachys TaxID=2018661 RepID=A0A2A2KTA7_9BILA|nr:hypothetical protein WR25_14083 isoform A [Diploscapter pachys]